MKKKILSLVMVSTMIAGLMAGCSNGNSNGNNAPATSKEPTSTNETTTDNKLVTEPTNIRFIFGDSDLGVKEATTNLVNQFNEEYKDQDISVTIESGDGKSYPELIKLKDSVGEFPDVLFMNQVARYARAGKLEPLSEDITSLFTNTTEVDGNIYTAPMNAVGSLGIYYNKAYFDEKGWSEPTTYDEFFELSEAIQADGKMSPLVIGAQDLFHLGFLFTKVYDDYIMSTEPDFIKQNYEETTDFSHPQFQKVLEDMNKYFSYAQKGWASTPDAQVTTFLVNDMSAMLYSGTHMIKTITDAAPDFDLGWFPIPSPDGKLRLVGGGDSSGLAISSESAKDPNKLVAAEEFIKFFFRNDVYKQYLEAVHVLPTTKDAPELDLDPITQEIYDATLIADELSIFWNLQIGDNELPPDFRNFLYKTTIEYMQGTREFDSALNEITKAFRTAADSYNPVTGVGIE